MCVHIYTQKHAGTQTYTNTLKHKDTYIHKHTCTHIYIYTCIHTKIHIYTHRTHMHAHKQAHTQYTHTTHSQTHTVSGSFSSFLIFPQYVMKMARISNASRTERTFVIRCLREETCLKVSDLQTPLCPLRNLMISRSVTNAKKKNSQAEIKFISTIILQWRGLEGVEEDTTKICCVSYEI